jgi:hypothetical protein
MKISAFALAAATLAVPACGSAATTAASGALLSTNLSAAVLRVNNLVGVNASGLYGSGAAASNPGVTNFCYGGATCITDPVTGPTQPCTPSPENGTALLAVLGVAGLLSGRFGYRRLQQGRSETIAA